MKNTKVILEITEERVLKAAEKCDDAREILKTLFPESFEGNDFILKDGEEFAVENEIGVEYIFNISFTKKDTRYFHLVETEEMECYTYNPICSSEQNRVNRKDLIKVFRQIKENNGVNLNISTLETIR